jgi:hypothetical protein
VVGAEVAGEQLSGAELRQAVQVLRAEFPAPEPEIGPSRMIVLRKPPCAEAATAVVAPAVPPPPLPRVRSVSVDVWVANWDSDVEVDGLVVENADLFQAENPLLERAARNVCAYWKNIEKGKIVHLGFLFQDYTGIERSPGIAGIMMKIAALAGIEPMYPAEDPIVETVAHDDGRHRLLFAANPTDADRTTRIKLNGREELVDIDTHDRFIGRTPEVSVPAYTIRIFAVKTSS